MKEIPATTHENLANIRRAINAAKERTGWYLDYARRGVLCMAVRRVFDGKGGCTDHPVTGRWVLLSQLAEEFDSIGDKS